VKKLSAALGHGPRTLVCLLTLLAGLLPIGNRVEAGGLYLTEVGTPGSLGTAGTANPTNRLGPDSAWTNPAGMTGLEGDLTVVSGMQLVLPLVKFDATIATAGGKDNNQAGIVTPIPSLFVVKKISERARFGLSMIAPLGGGVDYGNAFVGRYSANKSILQGVAVSPSFGYQVNDRLSVGGGVSMIYTILDMEVSIREPGGGVDGEVSIDQIDDIGFQGFFSLNYQLTERALVGLVYRSKADTNLEGDVTIRSSSIPFSSLRDFRVEWDNPQLVEVGLSYQIDDSLTLVANADWEDWSKFSKNRIAMSVGPVSRVVTVDRNWHDTWHAGLGLVKNLGAHGYSVGVSYDSSPVGDADRTFDLPVDEQFKISASMFRRREGAVDYALGATLMWAGDGVIDQTSQGVRVKGEFDKNWLLFLGGTLRYQF